MNPFDLRGPDFLALYLALAAIAIPVAAWMRWYLRKPESQPFDRIQALSPYEVAYLGGGEERVLGAAVARLVHEKAVEVDARLPLLKPRPDAALHMRSAVENAVYEAAMSKGEAGATIDVIREKVGRHLAQARANLESSDLIVKGEQALRAQLLPALVVAGLALFGLVKIVVGISRGRPVDILILLFVLTLVVAVLFLQAVTRTRRGDDLLDEMKHRNSAMEYTVGQRPESVSGDDLVMAIGLFGIEVVGAGPMARLPLVLKSPKRDTSVDASGSSDWSSVGSSCGGDGGGGGSCGGGCGGGGCGGCGG